MPFVVNFGCMRISTLLLALVIIAHCHEAGATHLRAADIIVRKADCSTLRYLITIRIYVNTTSNTPVGGFNLDDGHISFGDGTIRQIPNTQVTSRPDLGQNIGIALVELEHTYARPGRYKINYFERDRSAGIINIAQAFDVAYSTYVTVNAIASDCNSFPVLAVAPLDRACRGAIFYHNPGASDADGDSLSYEISTPSKSSTQFVDGYVRPDDRRFYTNFEQGNEARNGPPQFFIDPVTGLMTWDAPGLQGEYNIAFKILEWRRDPQTNTFVLMSETIRDMQILVEDCQNRRPQLNVPENVCVEAGELLEVVITGSDPDNHPVKVEVFSPIVEGDPATMPATYAPVMTSAEPSPVEIHFSWQTDCIHVRDQTYQVVFKVTDEPPSGPRLVTFETWNIRIIAPAPEWGDVSPDLVNRTASLSWLPYGCNNAEKLQVWRKVGSSPFTPDECTAGLSPYKGYRLLAELNPDETEWLDDNDGKKLAVAAQYCYRLVAVFAAPAGGKSYVSAEFCMDPILADAPVITHVTITTTDPNDGVVRVKWLEPPDISKAQYPGPYQYEVYRTAGFDGGAAVNVSGRISNLTVPFFDDEGVNTRDSVYNYRVVLYSNTADNVGYFPIDTSSVASTVRLSAEPGPKQIRLSWNAEVPWSNVVAGNPRHLIYRGELSDGEGGLVLIDSVDVSENGFEYIDTGRPGAPLEDDIMYCYAVVTRGTYGNSSIPVLLNRSQMVCLYNENDLPPCMPVLQVARIDCEQFLREQSCTVQDFFHVINWHLPEERGCRSDVISYNLYVADEQGGEFSLLASNIMNESFEDVGLLSFARCYAVEAVGSNGVTSPMSEPDCNDNCPWFRLPNVFTPNGDGCNDLFTAFNGFQNAGNPDCQGEPGFCPSFVKAVTFRVYNRWGRTLYEYMSDDTHPIFINWNGRDKNGSLLDTGVYFYTADVLFDALDPKARNQRLRGWVEILH